MMSDFAGWENLSSCVVILPTLDEANGIAAVLSEVNEARLVMQQVSCDLGVLIVDDGSQDNTRSIATQFAAVTGMSLEIVEGPRDGLGAAMLTGIKVALSQRPSLVITLDADGQHDARDIPTLVRAHVAQEAALTIGSRWTGGGRNYGTSQFRAVGSRFGNSLFRIVTGTRGVSDATTSFRVYSQGAAQFLLNSLVADYRGYAFFSASVAILEAAGYEIREVPITFRPRHGGASKLNVGEAIGFFQALPSLRETRREPPVAWSQEYGARKELEALSDASNWQAWQVDCATLGLDVDANSVFVDVGAGLGATAQILTDRWPSTQLVLIEPDSENRKVLDTKFTENDRVSVVPGTLQDLAGESLQQPPTLITYFNVLEHIQEDRSELKYAASLLADGGRIAVVVPAVERAYGPVDASSGHFRRYEVDTLRNLAGTELEVESCYFLDSIGLALYWFMFRLLNKATATSSSIKVFDAVYIPLTRRLQGVSRGKVPGKTLVAIYKKTSQ